MSSPHKLAAHVFILRHLEALWKGTHPVLSSNFTPSDEDDEFDDMIFPDIGKAIGQAFGEKMPQIIGGSIVAFLIVMLEQITIPQDSLPFVVRTLKYIHSQEPSEAVFTTSQQDLQSLINHLSSALPP